MHYCAACEKPASMICTRCRKIYFCGRECQLKQWKLHKPFCTEERESALPVADEPTAKAAAEALQEYKGYVKAVQRGGRLAADIRECIEPLMNPKLFCKVAYGMDMRYVKKGLPKTVAELMESSEYAPFMQAGALRAFQGAEMVFSLSTAHFTASGGTVSDALKKELWPSTFCKAFEKSISYIHALRNTEMVKKMASEPLASPDHPLAASEFIAPETLKPLMEIGIATQPGPYEESGPPVWLPPLEREFDLIARGESGWSDFQSRRALVLCGAVLYNVEVHTRWRNPIVETIHTLYPAIGETLNRLHAMPYELNRKLPDLQLVAAPITGRSFIEHTKLEVTLAGAVPAGMQIPEVVEVFPYDKTFQFRFRMPHDAQPNVVARFCYSSVPMVDDSGLKAELEYVAASGKAYDANRVNRLIFTRPHANVVERVRVQIKTDKPPSELPTMEWFSVLYMMDKYH